MTDHPLELPCRIGGLHRDRSYDRGSEVEGWPARTSRHSRGRPPIVTSFTSSISPTSRQVDSWTGVGPTVPPSLRWRHRGRVRHRGGARWRYGSRRRRRRRRSLRPADESSLRVGAGERQLVPDGETRPRGGEGRGGDSGDWFGRSVALVAQTALVGASGLRDGQRNGRRAVYVFAV